MDAVVAKAAFFISKTIRPDHTNDSMIYSKTSLYSHLPVFIGSFTIHFNSMGKFSLETSEKK